MRRYLAVTARRSRAAESCFSCVQPALSNYKTLSRQKLKEYSDVNAKSKGWEEVCQQLFQVWGQLSAKEKTEAGKLVQKRWKNIRTCFSRELREQKQTKSGQAANKNRRKYKYFDELLFLIPSMETRETSGNIPNVTDGDDDSDNKENVSGEENIRKRPRITKSTAEKPKSYEEKLLNILQEKKQANTSTPSTDKETHFALSLVPLLKQVPEDSQLDIQIEILQIFKKALQKNKGLQTSSSPLNYNQPSTSGIKFKIIPQKPKISDARYTIIRPRKASTSSQSLPSTSPQTFLPIISTTSLLATSPPKSLPATSPPACLPASSSPMSLPTEFPQNADHFSWPALPNPSPNSNNSINETLQSYLSSFNDSDESEIYDVCYK